MQAETAARTLVKDMLTNWERYEWSLQGFGMLRTYLDGTNIRLHVWDSRYRVKDVTLLHTHPWHFESYIVAGAVKQYRYLTTKTAATGEPYMEQAIICGPGGDVCSPPKSVYLYQLPIEHCQEGDTYRQGAEEIHESLPLDGTVTMIERTFRPDTEKAFVYYKAEAGWVSAEPRPATEEEIERIIEQSLRMWFR